MRGSAAAGRHAWLVALCGLWRERLLLRFRFTLSPGTPAGEHRWPVQVSLVD